MRTVRGVLVALALVFVAQEVRAEPTAAERETARTLLFSGREKKKNGQLKEALGDFEKAHGIMRVPTTGLDLGKAQQALGMFVEARATFLEAARYPAQPSEPRAFARARGEAKQLADEIAPRLATLNLSVSAGAHVKIDEADLSESSIGVPLKVNPGKHKIIASMNGDEKRTTVDLVEGESKSIELTLANAPPAPPLSRTDTKPPSTETKPDPRSDTDTSPVVWVGLAVAGVGLAVGTVAGLMAFGVKDDVASRCDKGTQCPPITHPDIDRGETLGTISTISFIAAGVGAGMLVYGLLNPTQTHVSTSGKVTWMATPTGLSGTF